MLLLCPRSNILRRKPIVPFNKFAHLFATEYVGPAPGVASLPVVASELFHKPHSTLGPIPAVFMRTKVEHSRREK